MAGIYIHIPFCKQKCHYCSFHFSTTFSKYRRRMIDAILLEIEKEKHLITESIQSIYFGGGTPSLLNTDEVVGILAAVQLNYIVSETVEITLEANPDDITKQKADDWLSSGVNRLSIGVQSFHEENLQSMNRAHNASEAIGAIEIVKNAGFTSYSVDLMFALPGLTNELWKENLQKVIDLKVPHLSCYNLTIEEQSTLIELIKQKKRPSLSEQNSVDQFKIAMDVLGAAGYVQYEISNYCLPGNESKHNSAYWEQQDYLGIGPSAHSFLSGDRYHTVANNTLYMKGIEGGSGGDLVVKEKEELSDANKFNEVVMTRLRCKDGLGLIALEKRFPALFGDFEKELTVQLKLGNVLCVDSVVVLTEKGKFVADVVAVDLFVI